LARDLSMMKEPFDRLYFESNALHRWPRIGGDLSEIFQTATALGLGVFIPIGTELERERLWLHDVQNGFAELSGLLEGISRDASPSPDWARLREDYERASDSAKTKWAIQTVALSTQTLEDAFRWALEFKPPFQRKRVAFRDAIIYLSVVEHLHANPGRGVLVSNDQDFLTIRKDDETRLRKMGVNLRVATRDDVLSELRERRKTAAPPDLQRWYERNEENERAALEAERSTLEAFLTSNLVSHVADSTWRQVTLTRINSIASSAQPGSQNQESVDLTANIDVLITTGYPLRETWGWEDGIIPTPRGFIYGVGYQQMFQANVRLEATATLRDGKYVNLRFKSAVAHRVELGGETPTER
jgi:hypothetical protein